MDWLIFTVIATVLVLLTALAHQLGWIDLSDKNRSGGGGGAALTIGDEVFHPMRHEAAVEMDRQSSLSVPVPSPGDDDRGVYRGTLRISLRDEG